VIEGNSSFYGTLKSSKGFKIIGQAFAMLGLSWLIEIEVSETVSLRE
jgi:hypothetical protein